MKVALFPNTTKQQSVEVAGGIVEFLKGRDVEVYVNDEETDLIKAKPLSSAEPKSIDFCITIGGDGTILRFVHRHPRIAAPVMPINLGSLGFMADIPLGEVYSGLEQLLAGDFRIKERMMLAGVTTAGEKCEAVNEIILHRSPNPCLIDLAIYVDGIYLNTFSADGLIFSTPTGSTAYSMASGGPIVAPDLDACIITPICPHTLSNRPIVLMPEERITVRYLSEREPIEVSYDGESGIRLETGSEIEITRSERSFRLVSLPHHDYFATLRTKLGWSGKLRL